MIDVEKIKLAVGSFENYSLGFGGKIQSGRRGKFVLILTFHHSICRVLVVGILINCRPGAVHHQIGRKIAAVGRSMNPVPFEAAFTA